VHCVVVGKLCHGQKLWPILLVIHCKYCSKTWLTHSICPSIWGGKLMTTSFSHLKVWTKSCFQNLDANWGPWSKKYLPKHYDTKKHDQGMTWLLFHWLLFWYMKWNTPFLSNSTPSPRWNHKNRRWEVCDKIDGNWRP